MLLPIEPSNAFLSILTLATTYAGLLSITPPNPNPHSGSTTSESRSRPKDTVAITTTPFVILVAQSLLATLGLIHAIITLYYPSAPPENICPDPSKLSPQLFTLSWVSLGLNAAVITASVIRRECFAQLGKSFTFQLAAPKELVTTGIYKYVQHPSYTTLLTIMVSFYLLVCSRGGLLGCWLDISWRVYWGLTALYLGFTLLNGQTRIREEERMMKQTFGKDWEDWHRRTKRLIPGLY